MKLLITGASGFLGGAFLVRLVETAAIEKVYVLLRPSPNTRAKRRLDELTQRLFAPEHRPSIADKLIPIEGDITQPKLGLSASHWDFLANNVNQILHGAANTDFAATIEHARNINVGGTRNVLELAEACMKSGTFLRFDYISTAFVAGAKKGTVFESDLIRGQTFSNTYEQSKYESELFLHTKKDRIPITIHRPSIVVGHSKNGYTPNFRVIYWPLKILAKGHMPFVPINRNAQLDIVPVDYVADAVVALIQNKSNIGKTFHLTAGNDNQVSAIKVFRDAIKFADVRPRPTIPAWLFKILWFSPLKTCFPERIRSVIGVAQPYLSYFLDVRANFDSKNSARQLNSLGIVPPKWDHYSEVIFAYCRESRWGQRKLQPEYLYYANDSESDSKLMHVGPSGV